ncbi:PadR family transcriptional regulator [Cysteiniphilum sp. QT6929]|uniref:PadR family transcriptional regulator n=1 Tax=Cysteiniphilum sp. QT6929 TaxID=2975055 RepID=UPI0024B33A51|nr:PadR family transcriptional regulator [Cysteiniphilum sp. QT6929]WHN66149.1 PadR family transcriptional regulator [Cysteiniphilum sp. QT6929]
MARENNSCYAILSLLNKKELSGYGVKALFEKIAHFYWSESNAQIYPMLKQLEDQGFVESRLDESSGKRQKRIYAITESGRAHLMQWLMQPISYGAKERNELLLKLSSGFAMDKVDVLQHVNNYITHLQMLQIKLAEVVSHISIDHNGREDQDYLLLVYRYNEKRLKAELEWAKETVQALQAM